MQSFNVGEIVSKPSNDETIFDLTDGGALLIVKFNNPNTKEKNDVKSGVAQFKFTVQNDIIFFLARFSTLNWIDAPFNRHLSQFVNLQIPDGMGLSLHIMFIDAATGTLLVNRIIGLSTQFSRDLLSAVENQPNFETHDKYMQTLQHVYDQFATTDLVSGANFTN